MASAGRAAVPAARGWLHRMLAVGLVPVLIVSSPCQECQLTSAPTTVATGLSSQGKTCTKMRVALIRQMRDSTRHVPHPRRLPIAAACALAAAAAR